MVAEVVGNTARAVDNLKKEIAFVPCVFDIEISMHVFNKEDKGKTVQRSL
jgi:hypothetical protein